MTDKAQPTDRTELIKEAWESIGWNQSAGARASEVSQSTINQFFAGKIDLSENSYAKVLAATEKQLLIDKSALEAQLAAKEKVYNKVRITPEAAARIRQRAGEILAAEDSLATAKLARSVLLATARYIGKHEPNLPPGVADIASERIYQQYEAMKIDQHSPEEIGKALGIYIARLEIALAKADLEAQQK